MAYVDELREAAQALLEAEEAYRLTPTLGCSRERAFARRRVVELLEQEPAEQ